MSFVYPFSMVVKPANIRLAEAFGSIPLLRRLAPRIARSPSLPAHGLFRYQNRWLEFDGRNSQFHALYGAQYAAGYELETCVLLSLLLRGAGAFVDAGANWGFFTLLALSLPNFTGPCVSFEPNPSSFADLRSLTAQAGLETRVKLHAQGLSSRSGYLRLLGDCSDSGCIRLSDSGQGASVSVTTLDEAIKDPIALIKMDVEGMEREVLAGGEKLIMQQRPFILLENTLDQEGGFAEPLAWLHERQYRCLVPALKVQQGGRLQLHHYGSPPLSLGTSFDANSLAFMPVTEQTRGWYARQLNLLACPEERMGELPGDLYG
jgi:FkbM family methyltransferase